MTIEELLKTEGIVVYKTRGTSMEPMLKENHDVVVIRSKGISRAEKGDVVLYTRPDSDSYILHRVVRVEKDGYTMMGDNQYRKEHHVKEDAVLGILTSYIHEGREIPITDPEYRKYVDSLSYSSFVRLFRLKCRALKRKMNRLLKHGQ